MELEQRAVAPEVRPFEEVYAERFAVVNEAVGQSVAEAAAAAIGYGDYVAKATRGHLSVVERGGKRTRGVLTYTGYEMFGGQNYAAAARAAAIVEMEHAYLLVMDDIADAAATRRGGDTAHIYMQKFLLDGHTSGTQARKLGEDIANVAAADVSRQSQSAILRLGFDNQDIGIETAARAAILWNDGISLTAKGQIMDLSTSVRSDVTEQEALQIATIKTAYYSFLRPLQLGATLAGATCEQAEQLWAYAECAGLAFQLRDDIIGLFGDPAQTGKSAKSDIIEGKRTVLMIRALAITGGDDHNTLANALGNPLLTDEHFEQCLKIIRRCGAYDYVQNAALGYADQATEDIHAIPGLPAQEVSFLQHMAYYGARRGT